jgi:hypothetical protein
MVISTDIDKISPKNYEKNRMHRIDIICTCGEIRSDWSQLRIVKYIFPLMTAWTFQHAIAVCARRLFMMRVWLVLGCRSHTMRCVHSSCTMEHQCHTGQHTCDNPVLAGTVWEAITHSPRGAQEDTTLHGTPHVQPSRLDIPCARVAALGSVKA